jgi:hypothetical protein
MDTNKLVELLAEDELYSHWSKPLAAELERLEKFRADVLAIGDMNAADFAKWQYVKMLIDEQKGR